jgi:predicted alpha/beta hydrolase
MMHTNIVSNISLTALDGYPLASTVYSANSDQWIVIGSATGVPRGFYRRFSLFAQQHGVNVITTDYRGIGNSRPTSLKGFTPDYADWSRLDLAAAVAYANARGPTWLVGHSLAGHAIGQLPQPNALNAAYVCAAGAGWHGYMPRSEQAKVWLMWNLLGPAALALKGYLPGKWLGLGEDLPASIYRQWRHWCQFPHYFFDDPAATSVTSGFADVRIPVAAANSTDDWWALPASRDAFFKGYKNAPITPITLAPKTMGLKAIGHMGYFRPEVGKVLWPQILAWLGKHGLKTDAQTVNAQPAEQILQ